jgi:hypothetical protein
VLQRAAAGSAPRLTSADRALIEDFYARQLTLMPDARASVEREIADTLAKRYGMDPTLPAASILSELAKR